MKILLSEGKKLCVHLFPFFLTLLCLGILALLLLLLHMVTMTKTAEDRANRCGGGGFPMKERAATILLCDFRLVPFEECKKSLSAFFMAGESQYSLFITS